MYAWESGHDLLPELQILTNNFDGNNDDYFAPEVGDNSKGFTCDTKPGIGLEPDFNDRQRGFEFGIRVNF